MAPAMTKRPSSRARAPAASGPRRAVSDRWARGCRVWLLRIVAAKGVEERATGVTAFAVASDGRVAARAGRAEDGAGEVVLFDLATGAAIARFVTGTSAGPVAAVLPIGDTSEIGGVAVLRGESVELRYADAPEEEFSIPLAAPATRLAVAPDERFLFAHDPSGGPVSIVDIARGGLAQAVAADVPVAELAFTAGTAFLLRADQASVGALHLKAIREGEPLQAREVMLGRPWPGEPPEGAWIAAFPGGGQLIAVHAESYSGFILHDNPAMSDRSWPMTRVHLRGGEPRRIVVLDRSFRQTSPGVFESTALLPSAEAGWELVLTTGLGGQTACVEVPTAASVHDTARGPGTILVETGEAMAFHLRKPDGSPAAGLSVRLTFSAPQRQRRGRCRRACSSTIPPFRPAPADRHGPGAAPADLPAACPGG